MDETELEYVGFWPRVGASVIDSVLVALVMLPPLRWLFRTGSTFDIGALADPGAVLRTSLSLTSPTDFLISWVLPAIAVILFWIYRQATPGKMAIGARIVDAATGAAPGGRQLVLRYLGYFVSTIPAGLGLLWVAFDPRKQGWHDKLAGTVVVRPRHRGPRAVSFPHK